MVSTDDPAGGLRQVKWARAKVWAAYFSGWPWYLSAVVLVAWVLAQDFAPQWGGVLFLVMGTLALAVGMFRTARRGRVWLRVPVLPRSAVLGTGHRGTTRSKVLLAAVWITGLGVAVLAAIAMFRATATAPSAAQGDPPVPATVLFGALAAIFVSIGVAGRRWAMRVAADNDRA